MPRFDALLEVRDRALVRGEESREAFDRLLAYLQDPDTDWERLHHETLLQVTRPPQSDWITWLWSPFMGVLQLNCLRDGKRVSVETIRAVIEGTEDGNDILFFYRVSDPFRALCQDPKRKDSESP